MRTEAKAGMRDATRRIAGRYRLGERIGRGGMATVYRAMDEQLDREVALKVLRAELGEDTQFVRRFTAEARRAASVGHPNVVAVYDVGTDGGPFMVMELMEGGDLADALRRSGRLEPAQAARIVADAAEAVAAAHAAGLVHRDVKPGNILIGTDGRAMVADFGIARATGEESMTRTGAVLGSVDYFSPEQARGERAGPASDVYALGVVLYELLTGRRPFSGETAYAIATARLDVPAPDPRAVAAGLPDDLVEIAMAAMAPEAADRPDATELVARLRAWLARPADAGAVPRRDPPRAVDAVPATAGTRLRPAEPVSARPKKAWARRRPGVLLLVPLAVAALAAIGFIAGNLIGGRADIDQLPGVIVGSPEGWLAANPSPSPTTSETAAGTPSPTTTATATPTPTAVPSPTPVPPSPPPTAAVAVTSGPEDAVATFYSYAESGRFDEAYALWSQRMRSEYPRGPNLDDRFADTADITFSELYVAQQTADRATVQANFRETYDSGRSRTFVGYWRLVRDGNRWLLDDPTY